QSGRRSAQWPRQACMGAMSADIRRTFGNCRMPPMPRPAPMRPAMCSTATLPRHLGATVTIRLASQQSQPELQVPLGAVLDDGRTTGVWVFDSGNSVVRFHPVKLLRVTSENAVVSGLSSGVSIVSLGAHLLQDGARVRTASETRSN